VSRSCDPRDAADPGGARAPAPVGVGEAAVRGAGAPLAVVVMGVSGCGKTSVGEALARRLGARFVDADDFHPPANVEKMRAGTPLDDTDRAPWLARLNAVMRHSVAKGEPVVLACSALKARYRAALAERLPGLRVVHLAGTFELISTRLAQRQHRYMPASLLASQFEALEAPQDAVTVDVDAPVEALAEGAARGRGERREAVQEP
jgi:gluconokinase